MAPAAAVRDLLVAYTEHPDNMLVREHRGVIEELDRMIDKHRALSRRPA